MKVQDLWLRGEIGLERSVEVRAPVVVGVYPMRIARYVIDGGGNGHRAGFAENGAASGFLGTESHEARDDTNGDSPRTAIPNSPTASH